jgi:hypothetical protein
VKTVSFLPSPSLLKLGKKKAEVEKTCFVCRPCEARGNTFDAIVLEEYRTKNKEDFD